MIFKQRIAALLETLVVQCAETKGFVFAVASGDRTKATPQGRVKPGVVRVWEWLKVRCGIVQLNFIDVVNVLVPFQSAADGFFHDFAMLKDVSAAAIEPTVAALGDVTGPVWCFPWRDFTRYARPFRPQVVHRAEALGVVRPSAILDSALSHSGGILS